MSRVIRNTLAIALAISLIAIGAVAVGCGSDDKPAINTPSATPSVGATLTETEQLELGMAQTMVTEFFASISEGDFKMAESVLASPKLWDKADLESITKLLVMKLEPISAEPDRFVFATEIQRTPAATTGSPNFPNYVTVERSASGHWYITRLSSSP